MFGSMLFSFESEDFHLSDICSEIRSLLVFHIKRHEFITSNEVTSPLKYDFLATFLKKAPVEIMTLKHWGGHNSITPFFIPITLSWGM